jgi:hypothetical protein
MHRELVASMSVPQITLGTFHCLGSWRLSAHPNHPAKSFTVALAEPARREILEAMSNARRGRRLIFTTKGRTPISGWSKIKRRLDDEILKRRSERGRAEMAPWRLDDLRRSMSANMTEHLSVPDEIALSCLNVQSGFRDPTSRERAYEASNDEMRAEACCAWAKLIEESSRTSVEQACARLANEIRQFRTHGQTD